MSPRARNPVAGSPAPPAARGRGGVRASLLGLGVGLAAAGAGAALGLAAERIAESRLLPTPPDIGEGIEDPAGGPAWGSVHGDASVVLTSDGVPLHVEIDEPDVADGAVPTIVFSHGYALTLDTWHYQRLALRGRYRLVFWDQRGHGRSGTGPAGSSTIDQVGRDLAAVVDAVAPDGPLVLFGHSMGGMTVMSLAAHRPVLFAEQVQGVALLSSSAGGLGELDLGLAVPGKLLLRGAPLAARLISAAPGPVVDSGRRLGSDVESALVRRYSFGSDVPPGLVRFVAGMIAATRLEVISDFLPTFSSHDKREALRAMAGAEVLVMVGDRDRLTPSRHSAEIVEHLPSAEHVVVRRSAHLLPLEHPDVVTDHVEALLERIGARAAAGGSSTRPSPWPRRTVTPVRQRWHRVPRSGQKRPPAAPAPADAATTPPRGRAE